MIRRGGSLRRQVHTRRAKAKFTLYTEGQNTEPEYFYALQRTLDGALIRIEPVAAVGVPTTIAERAIEEAAKFAKVRKKDSSFSENDQIWAVFDRDEHLRIDEVYRKCERSGVGVAFSDPCFELWLILHLQDYDQTLDRHQIQRYLGELLPDYDRNRSKSTDCNKLVSELERACSRSAGLLGRRLREAPENREPPNLSRPYTTVHLLIKAIRETVAKFQG